MHYIKLIIFISKGDNNNLILYLLKLIDEIIRDTNLQYRANVSWQSLEARTSRLDPRPRSFRVSRFESSASSIESSASSFETRNKELFAWLVFHTSYRRVGSFISFCSNQLSLVNMTLLRQLTATTSIDSLCKIEKFPRL